VTQHVDDELPAVLFRPHGYHQPLPRPNVAVAPVSGRWLSLGRRRSARTTLNLSLIGHRLSVRPRMCGPDVDQALNRLINLAARRTADLPPQRVLAAGTLAACRPSLLPSSVVSSRLLVDSPLFL
jgi:hypothetical protein